MCESEGGFTSSILQAKKRQQTEYPSSFFWSFLMGKKFSKVSSAFYKFNISINKSKSVIANEAVSLLNGF